MAGENLAFQDRAEKNEAVTPRRLWRRRTFLQIASVGFGAAAVGSLLAACGGGAQTASAPTTAPAKPAEASKSAAASEKPAAAAAPAFAGGGSLKILIRSHFVPAFDDWFDKWAADWGAKNKVEVSVDHIQAQNLPEKWAAEVAANGGHDLFAFSQGGAVNVYNKQLIDLSEIAEDLGKQHGGWIEPVAKNVGMFEGVWKGVPDFFIDFPVMYRTDLFEANGLKPVDTWDDLLKAGVVLKGKGNPIGLAINQKSNDANNSWHAMLWSFGVGYAREDGRMADLKTPEMKDALRFAVELYQKAMTDEVLSWDDTGNNQGLISGRISWTLNPVSALYTIEKEKPDLAKSFALTNPLAGPKARYALGSVQTLGVMNWSQNVAAAKAFIVDYYGVYLEGVKVSGGYNQPLLRDFRKKPMAVLGEDPRLTVLQDFDQVLRVVGHPGPPTPAAAEVEANWIVPLMVGRAVQGSIDDAIDWGATRVEQIYKKYNMA
jgi:multiple sugar transport system substrate-binding protein